MRARLKDYYNQIGYFDFLDKLPNVILKNFSDFGITNLIYGNDNLTWLTLKNILANESIYNQKARLNYIKFNKKTPHFLVLSNQNTFLFLEFYLNSFFKENNQYLKSNQLKITIKSHPFILQNSLISQFGLYFPDRLTITTNFSNLVLNDPVVISFYYFKK